MWNNKKQQKSCSPLCQTYKPTIRYSRRMSRGGNIQGVVHLQNQNYLVTETLIFSPKSNEGNKNPNNSKKYRHHDENHDERELYQENSNS